MAIRSIWLFLCIWLSLGEEKKWAYLYFYLLKAWKEARLHILPCSAPCEHSGLLLCILERSQRKIHIFWFLLLSSGLSKINENTWGWIRYKSWSCVLFMSRDFATAWGTQFSLKWLAFIARRKQKGESSLGGMGCFLPFVSVGQSMPTIWERIEFPRRSQSLVTWTILIAWHTRYRPQKCRWSFSGICCSVTISSGPFAPTMKHKLIQG